MFGWKRSLSRPRSHSTVQTIAATEAVEPRRMLAGNVMAFLNDGLLTLTGDGASNHLTVSIGANGQVSFSSDDGTTVNGQSADSISLSGSVESITARMNNGADRLVIEDGTQNRQRLDGDINIFGNRGTDRMIVRGFDIGGDVLFSGGQSSDWLVLEATTVDGDVIISGSHGFDRIGTRELEVGGDLTISGGHARDLIFTGPNVQVAGRGRISTGLEPDDFFKTPEAPAFVRGRDASTALMDNLFAAVGGASDEDIERFINARRPINDATFPEGFPEFVNEEFLTDPSGYRYRVVDPGLPQTAEVDDVVFIRLQYVRTNGQVIGNSFVSGQAAPVTITAGAMAAPGQFPPGAIDALQRVGMNGKVQVLLPAALAFGAEGFPGVLPAGASVFVNLELLSIQDVTSIDDAVFADGFPQYDADAFQTTATGLEYRVLDAGNATRPSATSTVVANYEGFLEDGTPFDSSFLRGQPNRFALDRVIDGWTEGLQLIGEGGRIQLRIPAALAFGANGTSVIPPNATVFFNVELVEVPTLEEATFETGFPAYNPATFDSDFQTTATGLQYRILDAGNAERATATGTVTVDYEGFLEDGLKFDSSFDRNQSATFPLNQVIAGWTEGLQLVGEGGVIQLSIPANLAYGAAGQAPNIPPNARLWFNVRVHNIA